MTIDELAAATGSTVSPFIWITYEVQHDGKTPMHVGNFQVDRHATDEDIIAGAEADVDRLYAKCLPDGTQRPRIANFHRGALRLVLD